MNALLIADNAQDDALLGHALRLAGFTVGTARDLRVVLARWPDRPADLLVSAIHITDPVSTVRKLRHTVVVPLIVIVDSVSEEDHLAMLDAGADWVIERPYSVRLLIGYAKVLMRYTGQVVRSSLPLIEHETVTLDPGRRTVNVAGKKPMRLSQLEFRLLHTLMANKGQVLPTETIVEHVWGYTGEGDRSLVRGLINRLRMKVEAEPHDPKFILTVPGVGYSFGGEPDVF